MVLDLIMLHAMSYFLTIISLCLNQTVFLPSYPMRQNNTWTASCLRTSLRLRIDWTVETSVLISRRIYSFDFRLV